MAANSGNSFKQLQQEVEQQYPHPPQIEKNVLGRARNLKFMGNVLELYVSRFFELLILLMGGKASPKMDLSRGEADATPDELPEDQAQKR